MCSSVSKAVKPILVRQIVSQTTRNRYGNLASESIGWVLHGAVLGELLKSSIDVPKYSVLLRPLLTLASLFLLKIWPCSQDKSGDTRGDFFVKILESENCLVVPPVSLIARILHYLNLQKARANIVIPVWPSSSFWPLPTNKISSS